MLDKCAAARGIAPRWGQRPYIPMPQGRGFTKELVRETVMRHVLADAAVCAWGMLIAAGLLCCVLIFLNFLEGELDAQSAHDAVCLVSSARGPCRPSGVYALGLTPG
jgi:hypothetical protein